MSQISQWSGRKIPSNQRRPSSSEVGIPSALHPVVDVERPVPYLQILRRSKWTIVLCAIVGSLVGAAAVWRQPFIYQAHTELEVQGINENLLNTREMDPAAKVDNFSQNYINTQARILQSYPLFDRVARRLNGAAASGGARWNPPLTAREVANDIRVRTRETDRIVDIYVESFDPRRAAAVANGLTEEFIAQDLESRWDASTRTSGWLNSELDSLRDKLNHSEQELQDYTQGSNIIADNDQGSVAENSLRNVQEELARAEADRITKEASLATTKPSEQQGSGIYSDVTLQQYQIQLTGLHKELAQLESIYAPDYYKIPPLKAQIVELEKAVEQRRRDVMLLRENEYQAALRREAMLRTQYNAQFKETTAQSAKMVRYTALQKEVDLNRAIYGEMLQKVKGYNVAKAMQASNIRIVDPAQVPTIPVRPNKPLIAILSGLAFAFCGVCWTFARAVGNRSIKEPGEAQQYLRSPELGVIPSAGAHIQPYASSRASTESRRLTVIKGPAKRRLETATWYHSPSLMAESFRSTSASLLLSGSGEKRPRVILVTSVNPSEGKTTVATNLAIALAGSAGSVLLIDADRHRARLHTILERSNDRGLSELLQADADSQGPALRDCIVDTPIPNLYLLPNGKTLLQNPDLLYSERMARLIDELRRQFDTVVIDTPPLLHLSDARIIGRLSDGMVLVLRAGRVRRDSAIAVEQRLQEDGIKVLGTVLNDWDPRKNGYGVYPHDRRDYSYFS